MSSNKQKHQLISSTEQIHIDSTQSKTCILSIKKKKKQMNIEQLLQIPKDTNINTRGRTLFYSPPIGRGTK